MHPLYQRLKELDRDTFEKFCFHLLKERHPNLTIKRVEGASGDEGADTFLGELESHPIIWQCKSFSDGIGKSQKGQIKLSLRRALEHLKPTRWILCIPVDMDIHAHRWFQRLSKSYVDHERSA